MCICWGEVTDVVIPASSSSFPTAHNSHAKGEEGVEMTRCSAQCSFRLLLTVTRTAVSAAPPPYLGNDHLPSKGPRASHYVPFRRRWRAGDRATGAGLSDVPHLSLGGWLGAPVLTENPQSKEKYLGLFSAKRWDYVFLHGKVTYLLNEVVLEEQPSSCVPDNTEVMGDLDGQLITHYMFLWHLDKMFLLSITWPRGCMHACMEQASVLAALVGLYLKGVDTCVFPSTMMTTIWICIVFGVGGGVEM